MNTVFQLVLQNKHHPKDIIGCIVNSLNAIHHVVGVSNKYIIKSIVSTYRLFHRYLKLENLFLKLIFFISSLDIDQNIMVKKYKKYSSV